MLERVFFLSLSLSLPCLRELVERKPQKLQHDILPEWRQSLRSHFRGNNVPSDPDV